MCTSSLFVFSFCFFFALFNNSTFEECDAANDSINSDEGEGFFFAITIRAAIKVI